MISTKGRYALRMLIDIAEQGDESLVTLKDVAQRQEISIKYLQHIAKQLVGAGILVGSRGRGGGYRLACSPEELTVEEVLAAADEALSPVACLVEGAPPCERASTCKTLPMWRQFNALTRDYLGSVTLADLVNGAVAEPA